MNLQFTAAPRLIGSLSSCLRNRILTGIIFVIICLPISYLPSRAQSDDYTYKTVDQGWLKEDYNTWYQTSQGSRLIPQSWFEALEQFGSNKLFLDPDYIRSFRYLPNPPQTDGTFSLPVGFVPDVQPNGDKDMPQTFLRWKSDQSDMEPWVGLTCAACHTTELTYTNKDTNQKARFRIDGGTTLANFQTFMNEFYKALKETLDSYSQPNSGKWDRFAHRVLSKTNGDKDDNTTNRKMLAEALGLLVNWQKMLQNQNNTSIKYGYGRLDAVGHIFNKVAVADDADAMAAECPYVGPIDNPGGPPQSPCEIGYHKQTPWPADAPVSYPFIWDAPRLNLVQWNGLAENKVIGGLDVGALGRNTGEAIGVFADLGFTSHGAIGWFTSVRADNLIDLEKTLGKLKSPVWDDAFRQIDTKKMIDPAKRNAGQKVFQKYKCDKCHEVRARDDTKTITVKMQSIETMGTDIWMACNAFAYKASSGKLTGTFPEIFWTTTGNQITDPDTGVNLLTESIVGALIWNFSDILDSIDARKALRDFLTKNSQSQNNFKPTRHETPNFASRPTFPTDDRKRNLATKCLNNSESDALLRYKPRPLNGIWATAPYLHNGSVPTLYDLLLPSKLRPLTFKQWQDPELPGDLTGKRPETFYVGTREFDPDNVGFVTNPHDQNNSFKFDVRGDDGKEILGNANTGHEYGTDMDDVQRYQLIEYLKSL
jgi:hypothetical protein